MLRGKKKHSGFIQEQLALENVVKPCITLSRIQHVSTSFFRFVSTSINSFDNQAFCEQTLLVENATRRVTNKRRVGKNIQRA